jgi:hypothetical protein
MVQQKSPIVLKCQRANILKNRQTLKWHASMGFWELLSDASQQEAECKR